MSKETLREYGKRISVAKGKRVAHAEVSSEYPEGVVVTYEDDTTERIPHGSF